MIHYELPNRFGEAGRSNQKLGEPVAFTMTFRELPCIGAGGCTVFLAAVRSRQYNFTANFLATATTAILPPRREASRLKTRANSGSLRAAVQAACTSNQRIMRFPCLLMCPSRWRSPLLDSPGFKPR